MGNPIKFYYFETDFVIYYYAYDIITGKGCGKLESGSNSKEAVKITTDLIRSNRENLLLRCDQIG